MQEGEQETAKRKQCLLTCAWCLGGGWCVCRVPARYMYRTLFRGLVFGARSALLGCVRGLAFLMRV